MFLATLQIHQSYQLIRCLALDGFNASLLELGCSHAGLVLEWPKQNSKFWRANPKPDQPELSLTRRCCSLNPSCLRISQVGLDFQNLVRLSNIEVSSGLGMCLCCNKMFISHIDTSHWDPFEILQIPASWKLGCTWTFGTPAGITSWELVILPNRNS